LLGFAPLVFKAENFFSAAMVLRLRSHGDWQTVEKHYYDSALHAGRTSREFAKPSIWLAAQRLS
jgi:hypothetical protein